MAVAPRGVQKRSAKILNRGFVLCSVDYVRRMWHVTGSDMVQFSTLVIVSLLVAFYGGTFLISLRIGKKQENADGFMTAGNKLGFGVSAASMTATWIVGVVDVRICHFWLHLRNLRPHSLRFVGRVDDSLHLSVRPSEFAK